MVRRKGVSKARDVQNELPIEGMIYHVLNHANPRLPIFEAEKEFDAFAAVHGQAVSCTGTELDAFYLMSKQRHLVVKPHADGEISRLVGWMAHIQRGYADRHSARTGQIDKGRFKSFPVRTRRIYWAARQ